MNKSEIPQEALEQMTREGWATMDEQRAYWLLREALSDEWRNDTSSKVVHVDHGGNVLPDRIEANMEQYDPENFDGPEYQTLGEYETDAERNR